MSNIKFSLSIKTIINDYFLISYSPQLCDLCGFAQTSSSHEAIKRFLDLDHDEDFGNWERYLWALSMGAHPSPEVLADVLRMVQKKANKTRDQKLTDTFLQTLAAMAKNLAKLPGRSYDDKVSYKICNKILKYFVT